MAREEKGDWLANRKNLLVQGVEENWTKFERDLRDEFARRDREKSALSNYISTLVIEASRIDELENENRLLKAQVAAATQLATNSSLATTPLTNLIVQDDTSEKTVPYQDYADVVAKVEEWRQQCNALVIANESLQRKWRSAKTRVKEWQEHLDAKYANDASRKRPKPLASLDLETPPPPVLTPKLISSVAAPVASYNQQPVDDGASRPSSRPTSNESRQAGHDHIPSSQTTEDDVNIPGEAPNNSTPQVHSNEVQDDENPAIVSERSLKRKRYAPAGNRTFSIHEDAKEQEAAPKPPVRVKDEPPSSPIIVEQVPRLHRLETLDLDRIGSPIHTPRKRRRLQDLVRHSQNQPVRMAAMQALRGERSMSLPLEVGEQDDGVQAENEQVHIKVEPSIEDERASSMPTMTTNHGRQTDVETPSRTRNRKAHALQPLNPNTNVLPGNVRLRPRRNDSDENRSAKHIHLLSEDGEERQDKPASPEIKAEPGESSRRLHALLDAPGTVEKPVISPLKRTTGPLRKSRESPANSTKSRSERTEPRPRDASGNKTVTPKPRAGAAKTFLGQRNPGTPLRQRPLEELRFSDFKINPKTNQGLDQAFSETVRGRAARRCLPGCTDPACCGGIFKAMAEAGPAPVIPRGLWASTQDDETDEDRLLRWHMGDAFKKERIRLMPNVQREELVLQAKTKWYADEHGKHRQAHERRASPPGYWSVDMPSTQEIERAREEAAKREKQEMEQRWREAMRPGGRWLFRDE
ncbi:hypothetical protein K490DRAFT_68484 [Saccharata proteae CBS 121410]|uniref:DNA endonuclease activator Ctp1 C-terminal domain-containing protein n=1 Tax=Saccharata proteae CBS 121410 TaxID=1314787 RepID=A0A9P4HPU1_9PEZI|nr:hypothetical protein K490DRAFT_68484 [Saccharata proteae CBS 121410]